MKKVSIVVPIYNMENSIGRCLTSLQKQDYQNLEIILVDDGSTDLTLEKCKQLAKEDERIKVIHTENRGSGPARNKGIEHANGEYIYFPDADDYLEPCAISIIVNAMESENADLVVFGFRNVNQNGRTVLEKRYEAAVKNCDEVRHAYKEYIGYTAKWGIQGAPWNKFFNLNLIKSNSIEYPALRRHQDEGFIGRYMCVANKIVFITDVLYTYFINDLKKEWEKYPVDYIDAVIGLNTVRKETIYTWNKDDKDTHDMLRNEYLCNIIKALELSFSPKMKFNSKQRKQWIIDMIQKSEIKNVCVPKVTGRYQRVAKLFIDKDDINLLYMYLKIKTRIEGTQLYTMIREKCDERKKCF